jgi:hypothetical protein
MWFLGKNENKKGEVMNDMGGEKWRCLDSVFLDLTYLKFVGE